MSYANAIIGLGVGIAAVILIIAIACYVIFSYAHMKALKALGYDKAWLAWILKEKEESYGYACLTNQKQYYMENWPQIAVEKGSVDQVLMIMAGGR